MVARREAIQSPGGGRSQGHFASTVSIHCPVEIRNQTRTRRVHQTRETDPHVREMVARTRAHLGATGTHSAARVPGKAWEPEGRDEKRARASVP